MGPVREVRVEGGSPGGERAVVVQVLDVGSRLTLQPNELVHAAAPVRTTLLEHVDQTVERSLAPVRDFERVAMFDHAESSRASVLAEDVDPDVEQCSTSAVFYASVFFAVQLFALRGLEPFESLS